VSIDEVIERPTLNDIYKFLTLDVVRESNVKMSLFTNWLLSDKCVLLEGPSSSGKTTIMDAVSKIIGEKCIKIVGTSDTAPYYMFEKINESSHVYIPEINKVNDVVVEILKDWGEGKPSIREVTVNKKGSFETEEYIIYPKPFIFARADENTVQIPDELLNRMTIMNCDPSEDQTKAVLNRQADMAERPLSWHIDYDFPDETDIQYHLRTLPKYDYYIHPAAGYFKGIMPTLFPTARRDFTRYLKNTYGITRFYHYDRVSTDVKDSEGKHYADVIMVAPYDMWANHLIYGEILLSSSLKCTKNEQLVLSIIGQNEPIGYSTVQQKLNDLEYNFTLGAVKRHMNTLSEYGYIYRSKEGNKWVFYIKPELKGFEVTIIWKDVKEYILSRIEEGIVPETLADIYTESHMDDEWLFEHPFTGEEVDVLKTKDVTKLADIIEISGTKTTKLDIYKKGGLGDYV